MSIIDERGLFWSHNNGTVIKVSTTGGGAVLHDFAGDDGIEPIAGLVMGARLGGTSGLGVVFSMPKK